MAQSFFSNYISEKYNLQAHDGRKLWQYDLSTEDYENLKEHIKNLSGYIDNRDITLFFSEWWKNEYTEGKPSKEMIFSSLGDCLVAHDDLYGLAKKGAERLGIKWLRRTYLLRFRTLLLQGGLPVKHISERSGVYTKFLKKVIELDPESVEDIAFDSELIKYLPLSSQNEAIYESCLEIAKSINRGDDEFSKLLDNYSKTPNSLNSMFKELREHKKNLETQRKNYRSFKASWILEVKNERGVIKLMLSLPTNLKKEQIAQMLMVEEDKLIANYQLIVNDEVACKIRRTIAGDYKVIRQENWDCYWNGEDTIPVIYLLGENYKYSLPVILPSALDLSLPTLWTALGENKWILIRGNNCKDDVASILYNNRWQPTESNENKIQFFDVLEERFSLSDFEGSICYTQGEQTHSFYTNKKVFEWRVVNTMQPDWMTKSNIPVIDTKPKVIVYKDDEYVQNPIVKWRMFGQSQWQDLSNHLPVGYIEIQITVDDIIEIDYLFCIDKFDLEYDNRTETMATIKCTMDVLDFRIKPHPHISLIKDGNQFKLSTDDVKRVPESIKCSLNVKGQNRALHFEIAPPFLGVGILNEKGDLFASSETIIYGKHKGFRLYSSLKGEPLSVNFFNSERPDICIIIPLKQQITPLRIYDDTIKRLLALKNAMNWNKSVQIQIKNEGSDILASYKMQSYNRLFELDVQQVKFSDSTASVNIYGIPVDCSSSNIEPILFDKDNDVYTLPEDVPSFMNKFVLVAEDLSDQHVFMPAFFAKETSAIPNEVEIESVEDAIEESELLSTSEKSKKELRQERINAYVESLKQNKATHDIWKSVLKYKNICERFNVPYSSIDQLTSSTCTPGVAAKFFCLMCVYSEDADNLINDVIPNMESDFGFCFHWVPAEHWSKAIEWIAESFGETYSESLNELIQKIIEKISSLILSNYPTENYEKINEYVTKNQIGKSKISHLNTEVNNLRQSLGEKVLNMLPQTYPHIKDQYRGIMTFRPEWKPIALLLNAPLAVALAITGLEKNIWNYKYSNGDEIRRNIQYVSWLSPEWYSSAIIYCIERASKKITKPELN